ncbi:MAG: alpha/beta hydrolase [Candidatus Didemnitutus sp.]|nr:alpha/beta hydrolase [Candidatus Didemnitutus sp.]
MIRLLKIVKFVSIAFVAVIGLGLAVFFSWRALAQRANGKAFAITTAHGIDEAGYVEIGGIKQWLQVRGHDRDNPVLLCVHGGPGGTWIPVTRLFAAWEKDFTVVLWDQRGAGKTLAASGPAIAPTMTIERMAQDGIEVAEHLRRRLGKEKIVLLGHSFGSILGVIMAKQRPDLFSAFVGTGQAADLPRSVAMEYQRLRDAATAANDARTLRELAAIGQPPFSNREQVGVYFQCAERYQPPADSAAMVELQRSLLSPPPRYGIGDEWNRMRGFMVVPTWALYREILATNLMAGGRDFALPVFLFQGTEDRVTPLLLAEEYLNGIEAPRKEFVRFAGGGHFTVWSHAEAFGAELRRRVRPLAQSSSPPL